MIRDLIIKQRLKKGDTAEQATAAADAFDASKAQAKGLRDGTVAISDVYEFDVPTKRWVLKA